jgi:membrane-associated phospholipid phosphatase
VLALDEAILIRMRRFCPAALTPLMRLLTRVGDAASWTFAALVLIAAGVYLGAHYPLDVAVGACIGLLCGGVTRMVL